MLQMWNDTKLKPLGSCRLILHNPKNKKKFSAEFLVVDRQLTPLIGPKAGVVQYTQSDTVWKFPVSICTVHLIMLALHETMQNLYHVLSESRGSERLSISMVWIGRFQSVYNPAAGISCHVLNDGMIKCSLGWRCYFLEMLLPVLPIDEFFNNWCRCAYTCFLLSELNSSLTTTTIPHGLATAKIPVEIFSFIF